MGFVNLIIELLHDPRTAIASWIAAGPFAAYGFVFLIVFIETGVVFFPFLPGDSLLFASGFFAQGGGFNIVALLATAWCAAILGDQCNLDFRENQLLRLLRLFHYRNLYRSRLSKRNRHA